MVCSLFVRRSGALLFHRAVPSWHYVCRKLQGYRQSLVVLQNTTTLPQEQYADDAEHGTSAAAMKWTCTAPLASLEARTGLPTCNGFRSFIIMRSMNVPLPTDRRDDVRK
jgi:hypothetical protein